MQNQDKIADPLFEIDSKEDNGAYARLSSIVYDLNPDNSKFYNNWIYNNQKRLILEKVIKNQPKVISDIGCGDGYWHSFFKK